MPNKSKRFIDALVFANVIHKEPRKDTQIPYISHLMAVSSLVMEAGGNENEVIAALLHDTIEDCKAVKYDTIREMFGVEVADIVLNLSDTDNPDAKGPWLPRKETYLAKLRTIPCKSTLLVSNADKLHNVRSTLTDLIDPAVGEKVWTRFSTTKEQTLWYYDELRKIFNERSPSVRLAKELDKAVSELKEGV